MRGRTFLLLLCACAHKPAPIRMEGALVTPDEVVTPEVLFRRAGEDLGAKRWDDAARKYDTLVADFPDSRLLLPALYNAGLAFEGRSDYRSAAARFGEVARRWPDTSDAIDANFKRGACLAEVGDWAGSREVYALLTSHKELPLGDRIEAQARLGYAQFQLGQLDQADLTLHRVLDDFREHESEERLDTNFFLAMAQYHLGAIAQKRYQAVALHLPEKRMIEELEYKAGILLDAQAKYVKAIRLKDPNWAAAAGYQIGALYRDFYDRMIDAPLPDAVKKDAELREVYFEELKKKIRPLLEKALRTQENTVLMAERTGTDNDYVKKANAELDALRRLLAPQGRPENRPALPPGPEPPTPIPGRRTDGVPKSG